MIRLLTPPGRTRELIRHLADLAGAPTHREVLGPLEVTVAPPGEVPLDVVEAYEQISVSRLVVGPDTADGSEPDRFIEAFQADVLAHQTTKA